MDGLFAKKTLEKSHTLLQQKIIQNKNANIQMLIQAWTSIQESTIGNFDLILSNIPEHLKPEVTAQRSKSNEVYNHVLTFLKTLIVNCNPSDEACDIVTSQEDLIAHKKSSPEITINQEYNETRPINELRPDLSSCDMEFKPSESFLVIHLEDTMDFDVTETENEKNSQTVELKLSESSTDEDSSLEYTSPDYVAPANIIINCICPECGGVHLLKNCPSFTHATFNERWTLTLRHRLCFKCLLPGDGLSLCPTESSCNKADASHHPLLHWTPDSMMRNSESCQECRGKHPISVCLSLINATPMKRFNLIRLHKLCSGCLFPDHTGNPCPSPIPGSKTNWIQYTPRFVYATKQKRWKLLLTDNVCHKCLYLGHSPTSCPYVVSCSKCDRLHHTMLHGDEISMETQSDVQSDVKTVETHNDYDSGTSSIPDINSRIINPQDCSGVAKAKSFQNNANVPMWQSPVFLAANVKERRALVQHYNVCYNCLSSNHTLKNCKSSACCKKCHKRHNTLIHEDPPPLMSRNIENIQNYTSSASGRKRKRHDIQKDLSYMSLKFQHFLNSI